MTTTNQALLNMTNDVIEQAAAPYFTSIEEVKSPSHQPRISQARTAAVHALRAISIDPKGKPLLSSTEIGSLINRNHSTVLRMLRKTP